MNYVKLSLLFVILLAYSMASNDPVSEAENFFDAYDNNNDGFWQADEVASLASFSSQSGRISRDVRGLHHV